MPERTDSAILIAGGSEGRCRKTMLVAAFGGSSKGTGAPGPWKGVSSRCRLES